MKFDDILLFMNKPPDTSEVATKADIDRLEKSTKADIDRLEQLTRSDIKKLEKSTKADSKLLRQDILKVEERVENLEEGQVRIETKIDKIAEMLDGFVGRVDDLTTDNEVGAHQTRELRLQVDNHEKRLQSLESLKQTA